MSAYQFIAKHVSIRKFMPLMNAYPPFLGAGIRVRVLPPIAAGEPFGVESRMALHVANQNFVGTHFGGSLYAMCDPFFMFILIEELGANYTVWDYGAQIRFKRPGRGLVSATFRIDRARIDEIRDVSARDGKVLPVFHANVVDAKGEVVAELEKTLYVRDKRVSPKKA